MVPLEGVEIELDWMSYVVIGIKVAAELDLAAGVGRSDSGRSRSPDLIRFESPQLRGRVRSEQCVQPGGTTAQGLRVGLTDGVPGGSQDGPGLFADSLGVAKMARVLDRDLTGLGFDPREGTGGDQLCDDLGDVAHPRRQRCAVVGPGCCTPSCALHSPPRRRR